MAINVEINKKTPRTLTPKGNHLARVFSIIQIGTVPEEYKGETKDMPKVRIGWELPLKMNEFEYTDKETNETVKVKKPFAISQEYTLSLGSKAKLRPVVEGIIGTGLTDKEADVFDLSQIMGMTCMVDVRHKMSKSGNEYAFVGAVTSVPEGMNVPEPINDTVLFEWSNFNEEVFEKFPDFIKDKIKTSKEWKKKEGVNEDGIEYPEDESDSDDDSGIPF